MSYDYVKLINGDYFRVPDNCDWALDSVNIKCYDDPTKITTTNCLIIFDNSDKNGEHNKTRCYPLSSIISWGDDIKGCP